MLRTQNFGPNKTAVTINDLDAGTEYTVYLYTRIDDELSDPANETIITQDNCLYQVFFTLKYWRIKLGMPTLGSCYTASIDILHTGVTFHEISEETNFDSLR